MIKQVFKSFPDNKPISALCIVEDITKCPSGYVPVLKTHDQDSDADLHMQSWSWKESVFSARKISRYLCLSKTEGNSDFIVIDISITNEKEYPPEGYSLISKTIDSDQKACRKRQLCYKLGRKNVATYAITDIILLSRSKKAPDGFNLVGDLNGLTLCYKTSPQTPMNATSPLSYNLVPSLPSNNITNGNGSVSLGPNPVDSSANLSHEYDRLMSLKPTRPAPKLPPTYSSSNYSTLNSFQALEGIPFVLNPSIDVEKKPLLQGIPVIKMKTIEDLEEYNYNFELERRHV